MDPAQPARRARSAAQVALQRCTRPSADATDAAGPTTLARLVAEAAGAATATADDHYTVTAVMLEQDCCGQTHTVLVELLEDHLRTDDARWSAIAIDELDERRAEPSRGPTAAEAVRGIDWCHLIDAVG